MQLIKLFILITFFVAGNNLAAQNQFSKRYNFNIPGDIFSSMSIIGDTIYLTGVSGDTSANNAEIQVPKNLSGLLDLEGNEIKHNVYKGEWKENYETFLNTLIKTKDNGFAICAGSIDTNNIDRALFIKYDSVMDITMVKEYKYPDSVLYMEGESMIQLMDGSYIITCETNVNYLAYISIIKIDSSANLIWWKKYPPPPRCLMIIQLLFN